MAYRQQAQGKRNVPAHRSHVETALSARCSVSTSPKAARQPGQSLTGAGITVTLVGLLVLGCHGSADTSPLQETGWGGRRSFGGSDAVSGGSGAAGGSEASGGTITFGGGDTGLGGSGAAGGSEARGGTSVLGGGAVGGSDASGGTGVSGGGVAGLGGNRADGGSDAGSVSEAPAVVSHYDYTFDLRTHEAASRITLTPIRDGYACMTLESDLPLRDMSADEDFSTSQVTDKVPICGQFHLGHEVTFSTKQSVLQRSDGATGVGFSSRTDRDGNTFSYLLGWLEQCPRFGPCDPAPERLTHFTFSVTHAPSDVVLCPGARSSGAGTTRCEILGVRSPSYSSFAIVSNPGWIAEPLATAAGVAVVVYDTLSGSLHESLDGVAVAEFLEWITALLGPYPYGDELRIAASPVVWLGMEHPANIVVRDDLASIFVGYANTPLHVVFHEITHQWAGDRTSLASVLDYLWKEAIAEYLAYVFEEQKRPSAEAASARRLWHGLGLGGVYPIRPSKLPDVALEDWTAAGYGSAPLALFVQLEPWVGRPALLASIQRFLREPAARDMEALRVAIEVESHLDLRGYFDAWIYGDTPLEWAELSASVLQSASVATVSVTQSHLHDRLFPCVVDVQLTGDTKTMLVRVDFGLHPDSSVASAEVAFDEPVRSLRIDPERRLLAWPIGVATTTLTSAPSVLFHP